jgi:hypothetical protein
MTDAANTPRTAAGRDEHDGFHRQRMESCPAMRGKPCRLLDSVLAIEAEAAAPTPAEPRCPFVDERDAGQHVHCSLPAFHSGPHDFAAPTPAERREALRELSRDADDLGIYVEPEGLDVLARMKHEETEGYGLICKHSNQHLRGKECGQWALRFVAEYDRLMRERQP